MSERRRIGLTMRVVDAVGYVEPRDALAQDWPRFMRAALPDADWMFLPNLGDGILPYCEAWGIDGLILTGGEDVGKSPSRDATERALLSWAARASVPLLAVCRGLQLLATEAGVPLHAIEDHVATRHEVKGTLPAQEVNSYHVLAFSQCPQGYEVLATAPDGSIEAIRHRKLPWQGWMWHPEREDEYSQADIAAIAEIFS